MEDENKSIITSVTETESTTFEDSITSEKPIKSKKKTSIIVRLIVLALAIVVGLIALYCFSPATKYNKANEMINAKEFDEAIELFVELDDYKDSKVRIIECNRKKLYDVVCSEQFGNITIEDYSGGTYGLSTEGNNLRFYYHVKEMDGLVDSTVEFDMLVDMTSNQGKYMTSYGYFTSFRSEESTCEGPIDISKFSSNHNSLAIDSYSGSIGRSTMLDMANVWSSLLAYYINPLLEKTGLKLTAKDLGFVNIE